MSDTQQREAFRSVIRTLIRPLARFCISRSLSLQEFVELAKGAFIDIAIEELKRNESLINSSRISVLTGLRRAEVDRLYLGRSLKTDEPVHPLARVIGQWEQDPEFCTSRGEPRVLSCNGDESEFFALVRKITTHIGPVGILEEMLRTHAAVRTPRGLKLLRSGAVYDTDIVKGFEIVARDCGDLITIGDANLRKLDPIGFPHARTHYDNILRSELPQIQRWLLAQTKAFHRTIRDYLSRFDVDLMGAKPTSSAATPGPDNEELAGCQISLTTYGLVVDSSKKDAS